MIRPVVHVVQVHARDVPEHDDWLTAGERARFAQLRTIRRRIDWRLGRWAAKQAVRCCLQVTPDRIEILAAEDGAPEATVLDGPPISLSLSHRMDAAFSAASTASLRLGCDLEYIEPRSEHFILDYFTELEAGAVRSAPSAERPLLANLCWSMKESALKAVREGLRWDTRAVEIPVGDACGRLATAAWHPATARLRTGEQFPAAWRTAGAFVQTVVADRSFAITAARQ